MRQGITLVSECGGLMVEPTRDDFGGTKVVLRPGLHFDLGQGGSVSTVTGEAALPWDQPSYGPGIAWDRLMLGHPAMQARGHPSREMLEPVGGEVPPVEVIERYLKVKCGLGWLS